MSPSAGTALPNESLVRVIGTFGLAAAIINITIGGGIFRLPANVAASLGAAAPLAYVVCALAMGLIVLCIADAGSRVSLTGGPYAYVGTAFGAYAGFLSGVLLWMLGTFATAAVSTVFASSLGLLIPALAGRGMEIGILTVAFGFWTLINLQGVTLGMRLNSIATVAKLLPLLLIAIGGVFFIDTNNLRVTALPAAGDVARTSLLLIFAFAGIECALVPSGEVKDSARTVPRAIALAMAGITVLYIALQVVAQGILGSGLAQATVSPLADAAGASLGRWARAGRHDAVDAAHGVRVGARRVPAAHAGIGASAPSHTAGRHRGAVAAGAGAGDLRNVREARDSRQCLGAGALPGVCAGLVATAADGSRGQWRHSHPRAPRWPGAMAGVRGDSVAADRADRRRMAWLRDLHRLRLDRLRGRAAAQSDLGRR